MKTSKYAVLIGLFSTAFIFDHVFAQTMMNDPAAREQMHAHHESKNSTPTPPSQKPKKITNQISGVCVVVPDSSNLMATPCTEIVLSLVGNGEPIQTRTDSKGQFEFTTEIGKSYSLASGSRFYEVDSPKGKIPSGSNGIEIHLRQKN